MNNRPTPRTDSAIMEIPSKFDSICVVPVELALDLERELGDALRELEEAREREHLALNAFEEEPQRASREGERVLEARRERDEAREDADHWKIEYEIVVARLCGKRHPRDNGIVSDDEVIPKLISSLDWISKQYDDSKPMHQVAMDAYQMSCTARAVLQKEETK